MSLKQDSYSLKKQKQTNVAFFSHCFSLPLLQVSVCVLSMMTAQTQNSGSTEQYIKKTIPAMKDNCLILMLICSIISSELTPQFGNGIWTINISVKSLHSISFGPYLQMTLPQKQQTFLFRVMIYLLEFVCHSHISVF